MKSALVHFVKVAVHCSALPENELVKVYTRLMVVPVALEVQEPDEAIVPPKIVCCAMVKLLPSRAAMAVNGVLS